MKKFYYKDYAYKYYEAYSRLQSLIKTHVFVSLCSSKNVIDLNFQDSLSLSCNMKLYKNFVAMQLESLLYVIYSFLSSSWILTIYFLIDQGKRKKKNTGITMHYQLAYRWKAFKPQGIDWNFEGIWWMCLVWGICYSLTRQSAFA